MNKRKGIVSIAVVIFVIILICMMWLKTNIQILYDGNEVKSDYQETLEYQQGMDLQQISQSVIDKLQIKKNGEDITDQVHLLDTELPVLSLGEYTLHFGIDNDTIFTYDIKVVDTTPPVITGTQSYVVKTNAAFTKENLDLEVYDAYDMNVLDSLQLSNVDSSKEGLQEAVATITDQSGNISQLSIEIHFRSDADKAAKGKQTFIQKDLSDYSVLLNSTHALPDGWEPADLTLIQHDGESNQYLRKTAASAWDELYAAAKKEGIHINVVSSFRTQSYQENLFNSYLATDPDAASYSAFPRTSEHELGLALDISYDYELHDDLQTSTLGKWMEENSYRYGWIVRYPQGKENITQYIYEPWHYRYVGIDLATYLHKNNFTLEEYYANRS
ncbi:M15 family metallopeptidase [Merdibacter massiliensis]|uniref:M15 family metallopeptidase n=1 Tax=Merdibacter massiliensis TaxID=1871030 RepID=UPI00096A3F3C|nr:M15 family metallopeptidase [Merdibacter massiliensis]